MRTTVATKEGIPIVCRKHQNEIMRQTEKGFIFCRKCKRNRIARDRNSILRDMCGTSARAAKLDMGLSF